MSLIQPFFLDTVLALGVFSQGNSVEFTATGFLYSYFIETDERGKRLYARFLVTNRHVRDPLTSSAT